jgi:hypothetical protein
MMFLGLNTNEDILHQLLRSKPARFGSDFDSVMMTHDSQETYMTVNDDGVFIPETQPDEGNSHFIHVCFHNIVS